MDRPFLNTGVTYPFWWQFTTVHRLFEKWSFESVLVPIYAELCCQAHKPCERKWDNNVIFDLRYVEYIDSVSAGSERKVSVVNTVFNG